jgi:hypothetical protein
MDVWRGDAHETNSDMYGVLGSVGVCHVAGGVGLQFIRQYSDQLVL